MSHNLKQELLSHLPFDIDAIGIQTSHSIHYVHMSRIAIHCSSVKIGQLIIFVGMDDNMGQPGLSKLHHCRYFSPSPQKGRYFTATIHGITTIKQVKLDRINGIKYPLMDNLIEHESFRGIQSTFHPDNIDKEFLNDNRKVIGFTSPSPIYKLSNLDFEFMKGPVFRIKQRL